MLFRPNSDKNLLYCLFGNGYPYLISCFWLCLFTTFFNIWHIQSFTYSIIHLLHYSLTPSFTYSIFHLLHHYARSIILSLLLTEMNSYFRPCLAFIIVIFTWSPRLLISSQKNNNFLILPHHEYINLTQLMFYCINNIIRNSSNLSFIF